MQIFKTNQILNVDVLKEAPTDFGFTISWGFAAVSIFFILSGYFSGRHLFDYKSGETQIPWDKITPSIAGVQNA